MENPYAVLFEPVQIGPVTAPNRFYQVPQCNGFGHLFPRSVAAMRGVKAEGGWGVVCTEETEIHYSGDLSPAVEGRLWDESDIPALALTVEAVHEHGALAGIELVYSGHHAVNLYSRSTPFDVGSLSLSGYLPAQARMADKEDLRNIRHWHRQAALNAKQAGFDIVYCYAAHELSLPMFLLLRRYNQRTDEYGGSLENRSRILFEIIDGIRARCGKNFMLGVRLSAERFGMKLADSVQIAQRLMKEDNIDFLDMSLWDVFKEPEEDEYKGRTLMSYFTELNRHNTRLGVAGKIRTPQEAEATMAAGADWIMLGRAAMLQHDWPNRYKADPSFKPVEMPVPRKYLESEGISPKFQDYIQGRWPEFFAD